MQQARQHDLSLDGKCFPCNDRRRLCGSARKAAPSASVFVRPAQAGYPALQETGGTRLPAKRALVIPAAAPRNVHGNLPRNALPRLNGRKGTFVGRVNGVGRPP